MVIFFKWIIIFYLFFIGIVSFILARKHLLTMLLSLEFIVLRLFFLLLFFLIEINNEIYFRIFFLVFRVCEGALGISLIVAIIRTHGNDFFNSFSILQC